MTEVVQCPDCNRVRKFGEWVKPPIDLQYQINALEVRVRNVKCDLCPGATITQSTLVPDHGKSNRLLPIQ